MVRIRLCLESRNELEYKVFVEFGKIKMKTLFALILFIEYLIKNLLSKSTCRGLMIVIC